MGSVSGTTANGFTYEADYQPPSAGRVHWTATFRHDGDYAGMRHGCVHGLADAAAESLDDAVKADIESTWTDAH
ncbi:TonB-dependent receptor [Rhodanobacter umsongensis]|uniref:TonB-dependent receptor n=1 Tax=Rhodanobacter umsongensis TaxID=633153 RepID=A0ABW0JN70_9GAMM